MKQYKKLTPVELRAIQERVRMFAQHVKEPCIALLTHIKAQMIEIDGLRLEIDELRQPDVFKRVPSDLRPPPLPHTGSPFTDNKRLFQAYLGGLDPDSDEYKRVSRWSGADFILIEKP